jgi:hypothetical protein
VTPLRKMMLIRGKQLQVCKQSRYKRNRPGLRRAKGGKRGRRFQPETA